MVAVIAILVLAGAALYPRPAPQPPVVGPKTEVLTSIDPATVIVSNVTVTCGWPSTVSMEWDIRNANAFTVRAISNYTGLWSGDRMDNLNLGETKHISMSVESGCGEYPVLMPAGVEQPWKAWKVELV